MIAPAPAAPARRAVPPPSSARWLRLLRLAAAALPLASAPAAGQTVRAVELVTDNDAFNFWTPMDTRPDRDYTHGMLLAVDADAAPGWGRLAGGRPVCRAGGDAWVGTCLSTRFELGQKLFTPYYDSSTPVPGQRPYAGWLFASATARVSGARVQRSVGLEVGVTGPPSLGEEVHTAFHRAAGFWEPLGWPNQLRFEPAAALRYEERRLLWEGRAGGVRVAELSPEWSASVGNLLTWARAGARARVGWRLPHPWTGGRQPGGPAVYAVGAVRQDWVGHNLFLDGNTFRDGGVRVDRRPWVAQVEVGAGASLGPLTAEFVATSRQREYRTQSASHPYSTITLRWGRGGAR